MIGFLLLVFAFWQKNELRLRVISGVATILMASNFFINSAYAGGFTMCVSSMRSFASIKKGAKKFFPVFIVFYICVGIYSYHNFYDVLPMCGSITSTTALFYLSGRGLRLGSIISCILWLTYDVITVSIGPGMMESFIIIANIYRISEMGRIDKALP